MKSILFLLVALFLGQASAFGPALFGVHQRVRYGVDGAGLERSAKWTAFIPLTSLYYNSVFHTMLHIYSATVCFAKHANDKGAKWAASKRPKKSRLSDIHRKPTDYALTKMVKPAEYAIDSAPASIAVKKTE
jgi:hypothetical protein